VRVARVLVCMFEWLTVCLYECLSMFNVGLVVCVLVANVWYRYCVCICCMCLYAFRVV